MSMLELCCSGTYYYVVQTVNAISVIVLILSRHSVIFKNQADFKIRLLRRLSSARNFTPNPEIMRQHKMVAFNQ